jgi:hypothetical protein
LLLEVEYHAHWVAAFAVVITPTPRFYFITAGRSSFLMEKREPGMVGGPTRDSALSRGPLRRAKGGQRSGHVTVFAPSPHIIITLLSSLISIIAVLLSLLLLPSFFLAVCFLRGVMLMQKAARVKVAWGRARCGHGVCRHPIDLPTSMWAWSPGAGRPVYYGALD